MSNHLLESLVKLSREFGREDRGWAILGEGNTSVMGESGSFYVKASGSCLGLAGPSDFTEVDLNQALQCVDKPSLTDAEVQDALEAIKVDPEAKRPSVETFVHAVCLSLGDCKWVGHGHPESVLSILCSQSGAEPYLEHIFPDAIVVCGRNFAVVPYIDPGFKLAHGVREALVDFKEKYGKAPKIIFLENHGPFILGQSDVDVINTMQMLDKWSKVILANQLFGGCNYLAANESDRIENRLDEAYRRKRLLEQKP
ncbi:MAG: Methylthioribulose-1-phosphate dehydratase [Opitutia bacterium UBA7350]|nr:MAG: Methylthioribulose-1-phosphate dehydratase [Opitutae bacterium UBA7350]